MLYFVTRVYKCASIHLFNKYLWNTYCVSIAVLATTGIARTKQTGILAFWNEKSRKKMCFCPTLVGIWERGMSSMKTFQDSGKST